MDELNSEQKEAVQWDESHVLILAGPGTGKTHTLTRKMAYILSLGKAKPNEIIGITFTIKAAQQMKERLQKILGAKAPLPFVGTFHSLCYNLLRPALTGALKIFTEKEQTELLREIYTSFRIEVTKKMLRETMRFISLSKNQLQPITALTENKTIHQICEQYISLMQQRQIFDYDDLLIQALRLKNLSQPHLQYLFIDEYQDINELQYRLIQGIISSITKVCAIGDPDQAIYSFRGSNVKFFLQFEKDFPLTKTFLLAKNYRSTSNIINAANSLIKNNKERIDKQLLSLQQEGTDIHFQIFEGPFKEATFIAKEISSLIGGIDMVETDEKSGAQPQKMYHFSDVAIIYRTNAQGKIFEEILRQHNIPCQLVSTIPWYHKAEIQLIILLLKYLVDHTIDMALASEIDSKLKENIKMVTLHPNWEEKMQLLRTECKQLSPSQCVKKMIEFLSLEKYWCDGSMKGEKKHQHILLLLSISAQFDKFQGPEGLKNFIDFVSLLNDKTDYMDNLQAVSLMTIHAAKGLEFPVVFIAGIEDGILPLKKQGLPQNLEEERRLFYVALTRAKEKLYLTAGSSNRANHKDTQESPFIKEIAQHFTREHCMPQKNRGYYKRNRWPFSRPCLK